MNEPSSRVHPLLIWTLDAAHMISMLPAQSKRTLDFKLLLSIVLMQLCGLWTRADLIFEQPRTATVSLVASANHQANGTHYDQWVWDSFSGLKAQAVTEIRRRGGNNSRVTYWGSSILNYNVSIFESTRDLVQPLLRPGYTLTAVTRETSDISDKEFVRPIHS